MRYTLFLVVVFAVLFLLDTFLLVPKGVDLLTKEHILDGDKTGWLTVNLKLITSQVMKGQLWRPATSMFLHAGLLHILFNTVSILNLGAVLEPVLRERIVVFFFLSGLFSALCMMGLVQIEDGLGASTGIFGLLGVGLVLAFRQPEILETVSPLNWIILILMVVIGNATDRIVQLEHLTGTLGGMLLGLFFL